MDMEERNMTGKQDVTKLYTVDRVFTGCRTAEEVVADIIKAHAA